jgi:hypothetical protein
VSALHEPCESYASSQSWNSEVFVRLVSYKIMARLEFPPAGDSICTSRLLVVASYTELLAHGPFFDEAPKLRGWSAALAQGLDAIGRRRTRAPLEETLATLRQYDDPWSGAMSLVLLAHVELADGDAARAQTLLVECAAI